MCAFFLMLTGFSMVYYGVYHWPENPKKNHEIIIDAEWEEIDPNETRLDIYV